MAFKKWQKSFKKVEKSNVVDLWAEEIEEKKMAEEINEAEKEIASDDGISLKVAKASTGDVIWTVGSNVIVKPRGRIKFEAQVAPVPMFKLPSEIRQYLINKWFTSDVYKKDKEWLEKHGADMWMIEKLKKFLTEKL